jgi:hypothetical protein
MTSTQQQDFISNRIPRLSGVTVDLLKCPICYDLLRKPVACQSCETPFCSVMNRGFITNKSVENHRMLLGWQVENLHRS